MADEPTPLHPRDPEELAEEAEPMEVPDRNAVDDIVIDGQPVQVKTWARHFPRAPIPGTGLSVRGTSIGQDREMFRDATDEELDDREFTVRTVHRQLDQERPIEDVRGWSDELLLDAGEAFLTLDTTTDEDEEPVDEEGVDGQAVEGADDEAGETEAGEVQAGDADDDAGPDEPGAPDTEEEAELEPLTFELFRDEIKQMGVRKARRMKRMIQGIAGLANNNANQIANILKQNPALNGKLGDVFGSGMARQMDALRTAFGSDLYKGIDIGKLTTGGAMADALKKLDTAKIAGLGDTSRIGMGLSKAFLDTNVLASMGKAIDRPAIGNPSIGRVRPELFDIGPIVRPEVGLLEDVVETLDRMHTDEVRTAEAHLEVMVEQTRLLKAQGEALTALVNDVRGQKWPRRAVLLTTVIAAIAAVFAVAYSAGVLRPVGGAALDPSPSPAISAPPAPSASAAPSPTSAQPSPVPSP